MARSDPDPDILRLGEALAALRRERGLSQAEAGQRLGMTSQGWGLYESGRRTGLFRPDVQRKLTAALDATPEDLAMILSRDGSDAPQAMVMSGVESRDRAWSGPVGETLHHTLSSDELSPWAESGVVLAYRLDQWPRRGQGCLIEMADGSVRVRLYDGADAEVLRLLGAGALERAEVLLRDDVRRVSAVVARLETT